MRVVSSKEGEEKRSFSTTGWDADMSRATVKLIKQIPRMSGPLASRQIPDVDPFEVLDQAGRTLQPPLPPEALLRLAEENAIHASSLAALTADTVGRGWRLDGPSGYEPEAIATEKQTLKFFLEKITPDLTFEELLTQMVWEMNATGFAAWEVVRKGRGTEVRGDIGAIYAMPPHTIRIGSEQKLFVQVRGEKLRFFKPFGDTRMINAETGNEMTRRDVMMGLRSGRQLEDLVASEVIFVRHYYARSPYYGLPRWVSSIPAMAEFAAIREFNVQWFGSGGQADKLVHVSAKDPKLAETVANAVEQKMEEARGIAHVTIVTSGSEDVKVQVEYLTKREGQRDGQFGDRREDLVKEILMSHQMPPYRVGWAEIGSLGGSAAREMLRAYRMGAIEPAQNVVEARLRKTLFNSELGGIPIPKELTWRLETVDWELVDQNLDIAIRGVQNAILTPEQATRLLGFDPVDDPAVREIYLEGTQITNVSGEMEEEEEPASEEASPAAQEGEEQPPAGAGDVLPPQTPPSPSATPQTVQ